MPKKTVRKGTTARKLPQTPRRSKGQEAPIAHRIEKIIAAVEKQLDEANFKATVADYIRLLQMLKEYQQEKPRDIEVTWVEAAQESERSDA